ncbi:GPP34 family phosphoprotein [Streptomyces roseoverticillatus]|uniref:GOLPH3/VPS74 family protein n=1 Tax=Streptomyces roseoverticillatus TaxID=66429 RepID=UPI001F2DA554|nr:GPP34 family phosphoprotein [Streptomyces roseoverticillatus]MCF3101648.1 GPP34 family phosphoprotein [Streptomyces roseoverticillatus]
MTTARDLMMTAMDAATTRPVEPGDLSLALAGAEVIDLLAAGAVTLDGDRIVPGDRTAPADRVLDEAAAALVREAPYEPVGDWLWRRGRGLASVYLAALEADGQLTRRGGRWMPFRAGRTVPADSADHRRAEARLAADEPVLAALATAAGIRDKVSEEARAETGDAVESVLAAVNDALLDLEAVRQRRAIEQAAFDNVWRGV